MKFTYDRTSLRQRGCMALTWYAPKMGGHHASAFAPAHRLRCNDSEVVAQLDAAFATDIPAELGYGF